MYNATDFSPQLRIASHEISDLSFDCVLLIWCLEVTLKQVRSYRYYPKLTVNPFRY